MILSKEKFVELYVLKTIHSDENTPLLTAVKDGETIYDDQFVNDNVGIGKANKAALKILYDNFIAIEKYLKSLNSPTPVYLRDETERLRSIWDTVELLRKVTQFNSGEHDYNLGKRP